MTNIYQAPKPQSQYSRWEWFKFIGIRIIFPPILLWDLLKIGANKVFGGLVSGLVLPAQKNKAFKDLAITDEILALLNASAKIYEKHEVITHDNAHLDTFEIKHTSQQGIDPNYQKYIINFVGNGMCYENIIYEMYLEAKALQANVVGFNFRNVGESTGKLKSAKDLVTDGIAQVQRLLDQGVSSKNITLKGHSLGAGIASLVAQHFHQIGQPINVFNGRSFSSLTNLIVGHIRLVRNQGWLSRGHKESIIGKILGWLAKPVIQFALALVNWEINAGSAFKKIPKEYRDYIVVRSKRERRADRFDDTVIPHYASIHKELTSERRANKAKTDAEIKKLDETIPTADVVDKTVLTKARTALVNHRENMKSGMKMEVDTSFYGHALPLEALHNRSGKTATTFFGEFFKRAVDDHAVNSGPELK